MADGRDPTATIDAGGAAGAAAPRITGAAGEPTDLPPTPRRPKRRGARIFRVCTGCQRLFASYELDRQTDAPGGRCRACGHGGPWHRQFPVVASFQQYVRVLRACPACQALLPAYRFRRRDGQSLCPHCAQRGARDAFPIVWDVFVHEGLRETRPA